MNGDNGLHYTIGESEVEGSKAILEVVTDTYNSFCIGISFDAENRTFAINDIDGYPADEQQIDLFKPFVESWLIDQGIFSRIENQIERHPNWLDAEAFEKVLNQSNLDKYIRDKIREHFLNLAETSLDDMIKLAKIKTIGRVNGGIKELVVRINNCNYRIFGIIKSRIFIPYGEVLPRESLNGSEADKRRIMVRVANWFKDRDDKEA